MALLLHTYTFFMHDSIQLRCARAPLTNLFLANWKYVYSHSVSPRIPITICFYSLILVSTRSTFSWITFCSNFATRNSFISCFYHFIYSLFVRAALSSRLSFLFILILFPFIVFALHIYAYYGLFRSRSVHLFGIITINKEKLSYNLH